MKTFKTIELNQKSISIAEAKEFLLHTLNAQIQYQREKYLREWTKDNTVTEEEKKANITALTSHKQELLDLLAQLSEEQISINLSIEIESDQEPQTVKSKQALSQR